MAQVTAPPPHKVPNYDDDVDFEALAIQDADFAELYHAADGKLDFQDPKAVQQLTKSILRRDFNLKLELPDDRLCPPVPVRYNYIRWIQDLLDTTGEASDDLYDPARKVVGLDIGTGASSVYPLLGTSSRPNWTFYATDIDSKSLTYAQKNVDLNSLNSRIHIRRSTTDSPLIPLSALGVSSLDFTMCNPPFYSSAEDMAESYASKSAPPSAACTGAEIEMICEGGDAGFVLRMVEESKVLKTKVKWFTSMLGKLASVHQIVASLKEVGVTNWAVTCLRAGKKTRRWAVAWSWEDWRPRNDVTRSGELVQSILPLPTAQTVHTIGLSRQESADHLNTTLQALDLKWEWCADRWTGVAIAKDNVWSRSARRKQKRQPATEDGGKESRDTKMEDDEEPDSVALAVKILVRDGEMNVRWVRGKDYVVFESFCGMLKRAMRPKSAP